MHLRRYRSDIFTDKYKRLAWDEVCRSITAHIAKDGYWYIHPEQHRTLSIREAARVQTFPDWFRFAGPATPLKQIGNAVPPLLGEASGDSLARHWTARSVPRATARSDFRTLLIEWHVAIAAELHGGTAGPMPGTCLSAELCLSRTRARPGAGDLREALRDSADSSRPAGIR